MRVAVPREAWFYALRGKKSNLPANGADSFGIQNNSGGDFYARRLRIRVVLNAAADGALAGTPLISRSSPTVGGNTLQSTDLVTVNFKIGSHSFFTEEVSVAALMGEDGQGFEFSDVMPRVASQQELMVSVSTSSGKAIDVETIFFGYAVPTGAPGVVAF